MTTIPTSSIVTAELAAKDRIGIVSDVYKKHVAELAALEDSHQKLVLVLLGVFGAGVSFLASDKAGLARTGGARIGVTLVVVAILLVSAAMTHQRDRARTSIRPTE